MNPAHLIEGTQADNTRDMVERKRAPWLRKAPKWHSLIRAIAREWAISVGVDPYTLDQVVTGEIKPTFALARLIESSGLGVAVCDWPQGVEDAVPLTEVGVGL